MLKLSLFLISLKILVILLKKQRKKKIVVLLISTFTKSKKVIKTSSFTFTASGSISVRSLR